MIAGEQDPERGREQQQREQRDGSSGRYAHATSYRNDDERADEHDALQEEVHERGADRGEREDSRGNETFFTSAALPTTEPVAPAERVEKGSTRAGPRAGRSGSSGCRVLG